jgi:murein DD-endopeptidase MepM/ murein hydrolase activator NlpD
LPGAPLTSPFGWRAFDNAHHNGVDFGAPQGTPIFAAEAGTVIISGFSHSAGNWVVINHGSGLVTMYMHNSVNQVSVGQQVARGQQIALVGNTGNSFGAHLHFQVEINGTPVNPMQFL